MILLIFSIEEPHDTSAVEPIISAVLEVCRPALSHLTEVKGYITVDKASDEIMAVVNSKDGE